jgi:hypothetical protein
MKEPLQLSSLAVVYDEIGAAHLTCSHDPLEADAAHMAHV